MTALPAQLETGSTAPDPAQWMPSHEAAARLGMNRGAFRRRCAEKLSEAGMAIEAELPNGRFGWWVSRQYDERLHSNAQAMNVPALDGFTGKQRLLAWARWQCVERYRATQRRDRRPITAWVDVLVAQLRQAVAEPLESKHGVKLRISYSSLRKWNDAAATVEDIDHLIDRRGGDNKSQGSRAFWAEFQALYLSDSQRTKKACWRRARDWAHRHDETACSYASLCRQLDQRIPPAAQIAAREPKRYRDQVEPTARLDPETFATNQRWESDQRICDVRVVMPNGKIGRPVLTAWIDWRTRRCVGWVVESTGNTDTINSALHAALADRQNIGGVPKIAWLDNGRDYISTSFTGENGPTRRRIDAADEARWRGIYSMLGIELHLALPRGPRGKARIERWFQTKGHQLDAFLPGHCGPSPAKRPESLTATEKDRSELMTLAEYREHVAEWIAQYNASPDHQKPDLADDDGRKLSPNQAYQAWCTTRRQLAQPAALKYLLLRWGKPMTVTKKGVRVEVDGQSYYYGATAQALIPFRYVRGRTKRQVFTAVNPHDTSRIHIFDDALRFVCVAELNHAGGRYGTATNRQQMQQVARERRQFNKALKLYRSEAPKQLMRPEERLVAQANRERREHDRHDPPPSIQPVQTQFDDQLPALQRAELKHAIGAETPAQPRREGPSLSDAFARLDGLSRRTDKPVRPRLRLADALNSMGKIK